MTRALAVLGCAACLALIGAPSNESDAPVPAALPPADHRLRCGPAHCEAQVESLLVAARRAASAFGRHDFEQLVAGSGGILLSLPGSDPSAPLQPAQAALLLHAFADGAEEVAVEVVVARNVDAERAYVEARRTFVVRGTATRRSHTIYLGMRLSGPSYRLVELRVVP